jgi:hypothetical protein
MRQAGKGQLPTGTAERRRGAITHWHWLGSERRQAGESKVGRDQAGEGHYPQRVVKTPVIP